MAWEKAKPVSRSGGGKFQSVQKGGVQKGPAKTWKQTGKTFDSVADKKNSKTY